MKIFKKIIFVTAALAVTPLGFAYCVYNQTRGFDVIYNYPIKLRVNSLLIDQDSYGCIRTKKRKPNDTSTINIYASGGRALACQVKVYNVGGYVMVTGGYPGNTAKFNCEVRRDPN